MRRYSAKSFAVSVTFVASTLASAAIDLDQNVACRRRIAPHLRSLKATAPSAIDLPILAQRAGEVDSAFAKATHLRHFTNQRREHVLEASARDRPARLRLILDQAFIVLGYEITRDKITRAYCADILP